MLANFPVKDCFKAVFIDRKDPLFHLLFNIVGESSKDLTQLRIPFDTDQVNTFFGLFGKTFRAN